MNAVLNSTISSLPLLARGKVRDNYAVGSDRILMLASDRLSAFDVIMGEPIPGKGELLTQMALFWFAHLDGIVPNHLTGDDPESVVTPAERAQVKGRSMLVKRLRPLPIEAVVRGYLAGSGWSEYQHSQSVCGVALPPGLKNASPLPQPIFTPATKAEMGDHDENISFERMQQLIDPALAVRVRDTAIALYTRAARIALAKGIIIADTKFEFGLDADGTLTLMDEVLTPDSSRFWPIEGYEAAFREGHNPPSYDKQFVRDWLEQARIDGQPLGQACTRTGPARRGGREDGRQVPRSLAAVDDLTPMQSRLLKQLDAQIGAATHPLRADCLRAERACLIARLGRFDEARKALNDLQQRYSIQPHMVLSAWVSLAEGLIAHYGKLGSAEAGDKIHRAYALSGAARETPLQALACAWLAHLDYVRHDFASMTRRVGETLALADARHHAAQSRIGLVIAQTYHFAGRYDLAQPWYGSARKHGTAEGDEATLAALLANMAWLNASQARQSVLSGPGESQITRQAMLGAESSQNFDALVGTAALEALAPIMRAQLFSLQGRHADALRLYEDHLEPALTQGAAHMVNWLRADLAWCRVQLKQNDLAQAEAQAAEDANRDDCDLDDRAATHSRLAQVHAALGQHDLAARHSQHAEAAWRALSDEQLAIVARRDAALATAAPDRGSCSEKALTTGPGSAAQI